MRWLRRILVIVAVVVLAAGLGAAVPRPLFEQVHDDDGMRRILVVSNPIHTDIVIPLDADVVQRFADLGEADLPMSHPDAEWLVVGWGSRAFYIETPTWSDLKPGPLFKALTLDSSVMHVAVVGALDTARPDVLEFTLNEAEFDRLMAFMADSFVRDADGRPALLAGKGYGTNDAFFDARGRFNALVGCNTWTARALRAAGLQTGWWNPLPQSLVWSLKLHN